MAIGAEVEADQSIVVLESMKMEIPVLAPDGGRIVKILVTEGQAIKEGQELAIIELMSPAPSPIPTRRTIFVRSIERAAMALPCAPCQSRSRSASTRLSSPDNTNLASAFVKTRLQTLLG